MSADAAGQTASGANALSCGLSTSRAAALKIPLFTITGRPSETTIPAVAPIAIQRVTRPRIAHGAAAMSEGR